MDRPPQEGAFALGTMTKSFSAVLASTLILAGLAGPVLAASVTNTGADPVLLAIVENGQKTEILLEGGQSEEICSAGCFLSLPNGDRIGLSGGENVDIIEGGAVLK